jgi:hypothetical protein
MLKKKQTGTIQINNLIMDLKLLEKQEQTKLKASKWREMTNIMDKISDIETK